MTAYAFLPGDQNRLTSRDSIQIFAASEAPEEKIDGNKDGVQFLGMLPFWKTQLHFPFPPFPYLRASNLRKIDGNFSSLENCDVISSFGSLGHF